MKRKPTDKRWVMRCDTFSPSGKRCKTEGEPSPKQPELGQYAQAGWFIGKVFGDMCPKCLAAGYQPSSEPHQLMKETTK
jgi:hypothetical protein